MEDPVIDQLHHTKSADQKGNDPAQDDIDPSGKAGTQKGCKKHYGNAQYQWKKKISIFKYRNM